MNLDFLDDIVEWAETASWYMQLIVKALTFVASIFPEAARMIREMVENFFDLFDKKEADTGEPVPVEEKRAAADEVADTVAAKFHGSGSLINESWLRYVTNMFVDILGAMRYGEDFARIEKAALKGYMSTSEDVRNAAKTHAAWKLFGV